MLCARLKARRCDDQPTFCFFCQYIGVERFHDNLADIVLLPLALDKNRWGCRVLSPDADIDAVVIAAWSKFNVKAFTAKELGGESSNCLQWIRPMSP